MRGWRSEEEKQQAKVGVARHMLGIIWHVLTNMEEISHEETAR